LLDYYTGTVRPKLMK
jgi:large subunit ribosomal protein L5